MNALTPGFTSAAWAAIMFQAGIVSKEQAMLILDLDRERAP